MTEPKPPDSPAADTRPSDRLVSLDALRGFDMFWIMGGESIAHAAAELTGWAALVWLSGQLHHPEWHGFAFYDLIFPLFLFMAGVAMPFSLDRRLARGDSKSALARHVVVRGLLLVLFGLLGNGLLRFEFADLRVPSVLGRIGLAYLFAGLIVLNAKLAGRVLWAAGLLAAYWAAMKFIPVPGFGAGDLQPGHTLADYIDRLLIGEAHLYREVRDPEGILSTIPAVGTCLIGAITGQLLKGERPGGYAKTLVMIVAGLASLGAAALWAVDFPINKNLWSPPFVLHCAGWSLLLLAAFYLVIDVWRLRKWAFFFIVIGSNSILIYMAPNVIDFDVATDFLFGGVTPRLSEYEPLAWAFAVVLVKWLLLWFLYRKRLFLKV